MRPKPFEDLRVRPSERLRSLRRKNVACEAMPVVIEAKQTAETMRKLLARARRPALGCKRLLRRRRGASAGTDPKQPATFDTPLPRDRETAYHDPS